MTEEHVLRQGRALGRVGRGVAVLGDPLTPVLIAPVLIVGFWLTEALIHFLLFGQRPFLSHLLAPDPHELWMRLIVTAALVVVAVMWRATAQEHKRYATTTEQYQQRLHEMTARLAYGDTMERRELADRLHEDVAQQLTAARMFLAAAPGCDASGAVDSVKRIIDRTVTECREIAEELSPPSLEEFGLVTALESLGKRTMRRSGVSVEVLTDDCPGTEKPLTFLTFQVASEVLELAALDDRTRRITVRCGEEDGLFTMSIAWDAPLVEDFFSADERITRVGGRFAVSSSKSATTVLIAVPPGASA